MCLSVRATGGNKDLTYTIKTVVGKGTSWLEVGVPALDASIADPHWVVQSKNGDLYIASKKVHAILKVEFNKAGGTSNVFVIAGTGSPDKGAENIEGTNSALRSPYSVSLIEDDDGNVIAILIADSGNHRVRRLDMGTNIITTIAGKGDKGSTGDGGPAIDATLNNPYYAHYDKLTGDIFIVGYSDHKIRRVFKSNDTITTVVGECEVEGLGDGGKATDACLQNPTHFKMNDAGEWLIADSGNNVIRKVDLYGNINTIAGGGDENAPTGDGPATSLRLGGPMSLDFSSSGELLVADSGFGVIRKMDDSGIMKVVAGGGSTTPPTNTEILAKTASILPTSASYARDGSEDIFMSHENGKIFKLAPLECYGVKSNNVAVCSGHGTCTAIDQCQCDDGWTEHDCSITHCFDIMFNDTSVCSGSGSCIGLD